MSNKVTRFSVIIHNNKPSFTPFFMENTSITIDYLKLPASDTRWQKLLFHFKISIPLSIQLCI